MPINTTLMFSFSLYSVIHGHTPQSHYSILPKGPSAELLQTQNVKNNSGYHFYVFVGLSEHKTNVSNDFIRLKRIWGRKKYCPCWTMPPLVSWGSLRAMEQHCYSLSQFSFTFMSLYSGNKKNTQKAKMKHTLTSIMLKVVLERFVLETIVCGTIKCYCVILRDTSPTHPTTPIYISHTRLNMREHFSVWYNTI